MRASRFQPREPIAPEMSVSPQVFCIPDAFDLLRSLMLADIHLQFLLR